MKALLLTFDVEEFDWPAELGRPLALNRQVDITDSGTHRVLSLLAAHGVRATFFITGEFARTRPDTVHAIVRAGHEPAVHGLLHRDAYRTMDAATAVERLRQARRIVEQASGQPASGVRTPRLQMCAPDILHAAGFLYDATPHPTWVPGRYCGLRWPRSPWRDCGLLRVPISVIPGVRLPVSWIWFRSVGPRIGGMAARLALCGAPYLHLYFHPWEAEPIDRFGVPRWLALRTGSAFIRALDRLLGWGVRRLAPMTVREFLDAAPGDSAARAGRARPRG